MKLIGTDVHGANRIRIRSSPYPAGEIRHYTEESATIPIEEIDVHEYNFTRYI